MKVFIAKMIVKLLAPKANQIGSFDATGKVVW